MSARNETREPAQPTQQPTTQNPITQHIETAGGANVAGNVSVGRDFVGRDQITDNRVFVHGDARDATIITGNQNTVQHIYHYFFKPAAFFQDSHRWLLQHRWLLICLVAFEILQYLLFARYRDRFLLPLSVYLGAALLLAAAICYGWIALRAYARQAQARNTLAVAAVAVSLYGGLIGQQAWAIWRPAQLPPEKFGIAVATFGEGPDFRITRRGRQISGLIADQLGKTIARTAEISGSVVLAGMGVVRDSDQGRLDGERIGADLVIWGQVLEQEEGVVVNFQILQTPGMIDNPAFPQILPVTQRYVQNSVDIQSGDSLTVKQITERQSLAITAFSLGLFYQSQPNYKLAADQFQLAVNYLDDAQESASVTDLGLALLYLGRSYLQLGKYDLALTMLNRAAEYRPNESAVYISQAYIYRVLGQVDKQQHALARVIELGKEYQTSDNWLPALYNSGVAYETLENYEAALREYRAILERDPTFFSAYLSAGRVLIRLKRLDEAMQLHQQAQLLVKENPAREIWLSLDSGRLYELLGQPEAAIAAYTRASALNPELATPYFYLAGLYERAGSNDAAFINYRKLLDVTYDPAWAHAVFAEFLYKIGDYHGAIEQYLQALRYAMYNPSLTYAYLGRAYAATGEKTLALEAFENALRNPAANAAYIHSLYANVLIQFNESDAAISHYETSLQLDEGIAFETKMNLARQYEQRGAFDKARALYESLRSVNEQLSDEQQTMLQQRLQDLAERQA